MKVVDMHCDTISIIAKNRKAGRETSLNENNLHVDINKMKKSMYALQNFALFIDLKETQDPFLSCMEMLDCFEELLLENKEELTAVYSYEDIRKNILSGKISALLAIEEGGVCKGDLELLKKVYERGVRMMTLLWNYENDLGYPNVLYSDKDSSLGLKEKGIEFIEEMEKLGIIVDVSHISDEGFYDVVKYSKKPFVASHSNARAISPHKRNLTDDMIYKLASKGGKIGLNYCPYFLDQKVDEQKAKSKIKYIIHHMNHITHVGGIECLGLGSDFDGMGGDLELKNASYLQILKEEMFNAGFKRREVEAIFYKNILNFYKDML